MTPAPSTAGGGWARERRLFRPSIAAELAHALERGPDGRSACEAAFALVLARHLPADEVTFGVQCHDSNGEPLPPVVQRASCDDDLTVAALMDRLRRGAAAWPRGARGDDGLDTFEIPVLTVEPHRFDDAAAASAPSGPRHAPAGAWLQVTLSLVGEPQLLAVFDTARLTPGGAGRLLASLEHTLGEVLRIPAQPLRQVHVLPPEEETRILSTWNRTARPFPEHLRIHEPFEHQADVRPDAPALEADGETLSYRQLEARANQVAHALRARGVKEGDHVGVSLERGANLVIALLGAVKAGAIYVPLDPSYPPERLRAMLAIARTTTVLTESHLQHLFRDGARDLGGPPMTIDATWSPELAHRPQGRLDGPGAAPGADAPCYVIFTSGSTGEPKGVVMSHRAVVNTLDWVSRTCWVGPGDRLLCVTPASFDLSVYDLFGALGAGATVVMASAAVLNDPDTLADALVAKRITVWNSTPATLERILPSLAARVTGAGRPAARLALRLALLSGDWIPLTLPPAVRALAPKVEILALGGATEAAIWSNAFPVRDVDPRWKSIPYGRPIQNARYHVLDRRMHPVPVGVPGDLFIGGACLADGYLHRPALTEERFVPDPFRPGERLYRTGDLARYFEDGTLEFLGRADHQVKLRGFRVELGEVEGALAKQPGIRAAACVARPDPSGQKALVGFVVPEPGAAVDAPDVLARVGQALPRYMVPSRLVVCGAFPLSANGKVDRAALVAMDDAVDAAAPGAPEAGALATPLEADLQRLWQELLGRAHVGLQDDFGALGGHSLLAVRLMVSLRERLGVDVPLSALARHTTIAALAAYISSASEARAGGALDAGLAAPPSGADGEPLHLITLRPARPGSRPPLVLVAGVGGYTFTYRNFPRLFGPEQPVYCFRSVGAEPWEPLRELSIEQIAAIYERELEQALPDGPVLLGGFSFGVMPALELARRLERRGRPVPLLISFDGFAPGYPAVEPLPLRALQRFRTLLVSGPEGRRACLSDMRAGLRRRALRMLGREHLLGVDYPFDEERNARAKRLALLHTRARDAYRPPSGIDGRLLLLRVEEPERWPGSRTGDPLYGWEAFVRGPISLTTLPGSHTTLLESHANQVTATDVITRHVGQIASDGPRAARGERAR